ncbi:alpha/beta hydrolase family protein [Ceratobasidium sp. AG-Ba]|nr:alpha/beta hydrolase family protein [Ceratobasidium sp. AG-Ba]
MSSRAEPKTIFSSETLVKKGLCPVTQIKGEAPPIESHSLYFEQHGRGPEKILFIMGLNSSSFSWQHQVEYFGPLDKYSILVFDNRGVGNSDAPRGPYTTGGMAEDVIVLLDYVGWTEQRQVHVVGDRQHALGCHDAGGHVWNNFPPWNGVSTLAKLTFTKDPATKVRMIMDMVFPLAWLAEPSSSDPTITNREAQTRLYMVRILATTPQTLVGTLSQMAAGLTHYVSAERLRQIAMDVPKIILVTGDEDNLVPPTRSEWIKECMGPQVELEKWDHTGHALQIQRPERFNALVERIVKESRGS